jgi:FAD/FMN-containing dehydrogenase
MADRRSVGTCWGRYSRAAHVRVVPVHWRTAPPSLQHIQGSVLPYGFGRSYGDSCLNDGGALLDVAPLDRLIAFDESAGVLRCEAGVSLAEILALIVPRGWFLPVVPGTKWVSVGGAIANDIHGKNHHRAGTFGAHVTGLEVLRSSGEQLLCSPLSHPELFRATVGGLGLTGLILWAEIRLTRIPGAGIAMERVRYDRLSGFSELAANDAEYEYTVAWLDCLARGRKLGRGLYLRGNHAPLNGALRSPLREPRLRVPVNPPSGLLNRMTLSAFNTLYWRRQLSQTVRATVPYEPFFFPLDGIADWNRLYGRAGFLQYQCVVPEDAGDVVRVLLERVSRSSEVPGLAVLKRFGNGRSPGLLSFPRPGLTLAVDFPFRGPSTLALLQSLDAIVREAGGAVYPAKDARMSPESFRAFFPQWETFAAQVDPKFSSSFWRRVVTT